jgi:uncharacterized protein with NRDE domain
MPLTDSSKTLLLNALKEWSKFSTERERLTQIANEVAIAAKMTVQECMAFLKSQNLDVQCDSVDDMKMMSIPMRVDPLIEGNFPNTRASVVLKCAGSSRSIVINPNLSISAGGMVISYDQLKKGIPPAFVTNAAEFVCDSFLYVARTGGKEEQP